MPICPFCGEDIPEEEYVEHYDKHIEEEIERGKLMEGWKPATITASATGFTPIPTVPPTPLETLYYINVDVAEKQLKKAKWWIL